MTRLKPIGIPQEDQEDPILKITPERVQKMIDLYSKNHVQYEWNEEDYNERGFEYRRSLRPTSYKYDILSIYRVRDSRDKSKEYYFYQKKANVLNDNNEPEYSLTHTYGYAVEKECGLKWNDKIKSKEPHRIRDNPTYFYKWDKNEVKKLLDASNRPCMNFTIGYTGSSGQGDTPLMDSMGIRDVQDFLDGNFEDLVMLNKSGFMAPLGPSLSLLKKARSKMERKVMERIEALEEKEPVQEGQVNN